MSEPWSSDQPIYKQLRDRVAGLIMDGTFVEGEAIPSVRQVSAEEQINHLTVGKAYQELVDEGVLEMKRGRGMFVMTDARDKLKQQEREKFAATELPALLSRVKQLGLSVEQLIELIQASE